MTLDVRSLWIASALSAFALGTLVLIVRKNYPQYLARELAVWGAAYLSLGFGFGFLFTQPWAGEAVFRVLAPTLIVLGISLSYRAITELKRQPTLAAWLVGPPLLVFAECILFTVAKPNHTVELFIFNIVNLVLLIRISGALMRKEGNHKPFIDTLAGFSYAALAVLVFIVILDFLLKGHTAASFHVRPPHTIYMGVLAIVAEGMLFSLFLLIVGERLNRDLKVQATHDPLTGLYNRRAFEEIAVHEISGCERTGSPLAIAMFDIDHFKQINDQFGHSAGDSVLKAAAEVLTHSMRDEDFLCRWGGEEFCALLPRASREQVQEVAQRVLQAFRDADIQVRGKKIPITVSIGVASSDGASRPFLGLVEAADAALYRVKQNGRNGFAYA